MLPFLQQPFVKGRSQERQVRRDETRVHGIREEEDKGQVPDTGVELQGIQEGSE